MFKKTPLVFSLVRDQSLFMTAIMSLLTFLSVLTLGIALSIGTGVARWNSQWDLYATVQIMSEDNSAATQRILDNNRDKLASVTEVNKADMEKMLRPWMSGGSGALGNYLPKMFEIKFKKKSDIKPIGAELSKHARFLTHEKFNRCGMENDLDFSLGIITDHWRNRCMYFLYRTQYRIAAQT